jgi:4-amino-4-deoxy-L-arabinose transferase-like glycosyltransferase
VNADSVIYLDAARRLASDQSLDAFQYGTVKPLTHYPPLFPALIAGLIQLGLPAEGAARALNITLFGVTIVLLAAIVRRVHGSALVALSAAAVVLFAPRVFLAHTKLMSDPLMLPLELLCLYLLALYVREGSTSALRFAALVAAVAALARYPGIALGATGVLVILWLGRVHFPQLRTRVIQALTFLLVSFGPVLTWLIWNHMTAGNATNRTIAFHPELRHSLYLAVLSISRWVVPFGSSAMALRLLIVIALGVALGWAFRLLWHEPDRRGAFARVVAAFVGLYFVFLAASITLVDAQTEIDGRILLPVFLALVPVAALALERQIALTPRLRSPLIALVGLLVAPACVATLLDAVYLHKNGNGYANSPWTDDVIEMVGQVPQSVAIYSNAPEVIYYLTAREAREIPAPLNRWTRKPRPTYQAETAEMRAALHNQHAVALYLEALPRKFVAGPVELSKQMQVSAISFPNEIVVVGPRFAWPATQKKAKY